MHSSKNKSESKSGTSAPRKHVHKATVNYAADGGVLYGKEHVTLPSSIAAIMKDHGVSLTEDQVKGVSASRSVPGPAAGSTGQSRGPMQAQGSPARIEGGDCKRESGTNCGVCGEGKTTGNVGPSRSHHTDFSESLPSESKVLCPKLGAPDPAVIGSKWDVAAFESDGHLITRSRAGSIMDYTGSNAFMAEESSKNASVSQGSERNTLFENNFRSRNSTLEPNRIGFCKGLVGCCSVSGDSVLGKDRSGSVGPSRSHHTDFSEILPSESKVLCPKLEAPDLAIIGDKRDAVTFESDGHLVTRSRAGSIMNYTGNFAFIAEESSKNAWVSQGSERNTLFVNNFRSRNSTPNRIGVSKGGTPDLAIIGDKRDTVTFEVDGNLVTRSRAGSIMNYTGSFAFMAEQSSTNASIEERSQQNTVFTFLAETSFWGSQKLPACSRAHNSALEPNRIGFGGTTNRVSQFVSENNNDFSANSGSKLEESRDKKDGKKRGSSPFFAFQKMMRPIIVKEMPDLRQIEIAAELGKRWRALSEEEKRKFG